jgi:phosphatidylglycerophosphate synthase
MAESVPLSSTDTTRQRPWDARLARRLVSPLKDSRVTPNHLTTIRLAVGIAAAYAFTAGTYGWSNLGALLLALSNFLDHADGELARISGRSSRAGHLYDLGSDALVTVLLFVAIGIGVGTTDPVNGTLLSIPPPELGLVAGIAVAAIFLLRMRIETMAGKTGTRQAMLAGFETEDVLYLLPLITVGNATTSFLIAASVGAPLFAVWVAIDYRRTLSRLQQDAATGLSRGTALAPATSDTEADRLLRDGIADQDLSDLRRQFEEQGAFISVPGFAAAEVTERLVRAMDAAGPMINRNYIPGHKQGGSVSRHSLDQVAPFVGELYRSTALIDWLSGLCGQRLLQTPPEDAHAYALYFYSRAGDHIGWHYDTSYYAGRRYTLLLGVFDQSCCLLEYELHTREVGGTVTRGSIRMAPGDLVFFDGDKLRHRITPSKAGEVRVSLTFEYVTDPRMQPWWRLVSNMKDAIAYFGFRQVFRR